MGSSTRRCESYSPTGTFHIWQDDGQLDPEVWKLLTDRHLLTEEECHTLHTYKGFKPFLAVYWALTVYMLYTLCV